MRRKTKKAIAWILAAGALTAGICAMGYAARGDNGKLFGNSDIATWHWTEKVSKPSGDNTGDNPDPVEDLNVNAWGRVYTGEGEELKTRREMPTAMVIAASVDPETEIAAQMDSPTVVVGASHELIYNNVTLTWSIAFNDGTDCSEYVIIDSQGDVSGAEIKSQCILKCLKGFSKPIILCCTADNGKYATTQIDYLRRSTEIVDLKLNSTDFTQPLNIGFGIAMANEGTCLSKSRVFIFDMSVRDEFKTHFESYLKFKVEYTNFTYTIADGAIIAKLKEFTLDPEMFIKNYNSYDQAHKDAINYAWKAGYTKFRRTPITPGGIVSHYTNIDLNITYRGYADEARTKLQEELTTTATGYINGNTLGGAVEPNIWVADVDPL